MKGYSPVVPLKYDKVDGPYLMNKDIKSSVKQNFKMLLLTNPGERVMNVNYGVGLRRVLFSNYTDLLRQEIKASIFNQVKRYMPFIIINNIQITELNNKDQNAISLLIDYQIPSIKEVDQISLILNSN